MESYLTAPISSLILAFDCCCFFFVVVVVFLFFLILCFCDEAAHLRSAIMRHPCSFCFNHPSRVYHQF